MRKTVTALAAAATIATAIVTMPSPAEARRGWWGGAAVGGLALGLIAASAYRPGYGYGYGYGYAPQYGYAPGPYYGYAPAYYRPYRHHRAYRHHRHHRYYR